MNSVQVAADRSRFQIELGFASAGLDLIISSLNAAEVSLNCDGTGTSRYDFFLMH
jgi:hypothetical protein